VSLPSVNILDTQNCGTILTFSCRWCCWQLCRYKDGERVRNWELADLVDSRSLSRW